MDLSTAALLVLTAAAALIAARGLAWGPGIHIQLTRRVLEQLERRREPAPLHKVVLAHADAFYYGNIAADIINLKNYGGVKNHCHNWNIEDRLEALARTDLERAFVLGYLCHLAADVIAHNHFIPYHVVHGLPPRLLGHAYWEALADAEVTDEEWDIVADLRHDRTLHANDKLIWSAVRWKALGHRSYKWIFNNILLLNLRRSWRELIRAARSRRGRHPLDAEFFHHCRTRCVHDMLAVFEREKLSLLKLRDPTGRAALRAARVLRRDLLLEHGSHEGAKTASRRLAREAYWGF
ncbi:MAG: zinc dependent phospholipase C family protein [Thermoanaerobaculia bacterium]